MSKLTRLYQDYKQWIRNLKSRFRRKREFRLLGYYNSPNQRMNPEEDFPKEAEEICKLLALSFRNLSTSSDAYAKIKETFATAVFIFKDREDKLFAYFPKENLVRITKVVYDRRGIHKVDGILRRWFVIGEDFFVKGHEQRTSAYKK